MPGATIAVDVETRTVTTSDGVRLPVEVAGEGPTVLLLHGFPDDRRMWDPVADRLVASGHRVVRYDQRGLGDADAPVGRHHYRFDRIVEDAVEVLGVVGDGAPVTVVGHDWGALISWGLSIARPDLVARHVAVSVGHPRSYRASGLEQKWRGLYTIAFQAVGLVERILLARDGLALRRWARSHPHLDRAVAHLSRPGRLTAGINWYRANLALVFLRRWRDCAVPTLGVHGTGDVYLTERQITGSARFVDAEWAYVRVVGARHWVPVERPDEIAGLIARWAAGAAPVGRTADVAVGAAG
ncbi:MAG: alpha/beta fold hydrolase [Solirubrobacteraceae bacterium]|nr:alpha/beta fold hydrolase [Solirubrobacteraceae bacterium]